MEVDGHNILLTSKLGPDFLTHQSLSFLPNQESVHSTKPNPPNQTHETEPTKPSL